MKPTWSVEEKAWLDPLRERLKAVNIAAAAEAVDCAAITLRKFAAGDNELSGPMLARLAQALDMALVHQGAGQTGKRRRAKRINMGDNKEAEADRLLRVNLGNAVRAALERSGLTSAEVADAVGCAASTIRSIAACRVLPGAALVLRLCRELRIKAGDLA